MNQASRKEGDVGNKDEDMNYLDIKEWAHLLS